MRNFFRALFICFVSIVLFLPALSQAQTSTIIFDNPLGTMSFGELIDRITQYLLYIAIIIVPLMLIGAGLLFLFAGGSEQRVSQAKSMAFWAIVGLVIVILSRAIVLVIQDILFV